MKLFYGIVFIVYAAAEFFIIVRLKKRRQKTGARATIRSFGMILLLTLSVYLFNLKMSYLLMILAVVFVFLDSYIGYYLNYYTKSRIVDRWLHCYGTFTLSLLFYNLILLVTQEGGSKVFRALFVLLLGIALGAVHEIMEFVTDLKQNSKMQKGLRDTNLDNIFNIIGSSLAAATAYFFMS